MKEVGQGGERRGEPSKREERGSLCVCSCIINLCKEDIQQDDSH